jgi:hypothetical protein
MRIAAVLILLFTLTAGTASACVTEAAQFKPWMNEYSKYQQGAEADLIDVARFQGYVVGVLDVHGLEGLVCASSDVTRGDIGDVVMRRFDDWMKANSALPSQTCASDVVAAILMKRFPCDPKPDAKPPAK